MLFKSYNDAVSYLGNRQNKKFPSGSPRNTRIMRWHDDQIVVRYCWTNVVIYAPESITLNTNGYRTITTKRRINQCAPVDVYSKKIQLVCVH